MAHPTLLNWLAQKSHLADLGLCPSEFAKRFCSEGGLGFTDCWPIGVWIQKNPEFKLRRLTCSSESPSLSALSKYFPLFLLPTLTFTFVPTFKTYMMPPLILLTSLTALHGVLNTTHRFLLKLNFASIDFSYFLIYCLSQVIHMFLGYK